MLPDPSTTNTTIGGVWAACTTALAHTLLLLPLRGAGRGGLDKSGPPGGGRTPGAGAPASGDVGPRPVERPLDPTRLAPVRSGEPHAMSTRQIPRHSSEHARCADMAFTTLS